MEIDSEIDALNHHVDALDELLNQQKYRLAYWRTADQELGYRRFFDVNTLIGVRVGREHVLNVHTRQNPGMAADEPPGRCAGGPCRRLARRLRYFERLRARAPEAWIIGEKILEPGEYLRKEWPIDGTSGYDFMNVCNALLVRTEGLRELTAIYGNFTVSRSSLRK